VARVVDVPLNTAIADLDEALRKLLKRELGRHGFDAVEIAFEAPAREWSGKLTGPTVDLFLYDVRQASEGGTSTVAEHRGNGTGTMVAPSLRLELTYAVTAWTTAVEDEHRLLSQVLAVLFSYSNLPAELLTASILSSTTKVGRPREEKADFWNAVGGQYKASIDYVVNLTVESGVTIVRGPEVRTRTMRLRQSDGSAATLEELHGFGGTIVDADDNPVGNAWVVLPELGQWVASETNGRFRFARVRAGTHRVEVRSIDGRTADATVTVPGGGVDVVVRAARRGAGRAHRSP
jgi:hypothetical protein